MKAKYDVDRAKLDLGKRDLVSRIEYEGAKLSLADAEQRLKEVEAKALSVKAGADAEMLGKKRKRDKAQADVDRTVASIEALRLRTPADGTVNILQNPRSGNMFGGGGVEFREGDRAWAGASILELPDLSSIHLEARLDESDRGPAEGRPDRVGQDRSGARQGPGGARRSHLGPRARRLFVGLAAGPQLRPRSGPRRSRSAHPSRHDGHRAHRGGPPAERDARSRPKRSSRRTAVPSSTS